MSSLTNANITQLLERRSWDARDGTGESAVCEILKQLRRVRSNTGLSTRTIRGTGAEVEPMRPASGLVNQKQDGGRGHTSYATGRAQMAIPRDALA